MRKLSLILITVLSFGCSQNEYKIEKGKVGKLFKENLVKQLDSIYKNDSIVRRIGEGDYMFSGDDKYLIFNNKKEHLLTLTPRNQHDTSEPIETIEIISDLFKTDSGISVNSSFGEIDKNHKLGNNEVISYNHKTVQVLVKVVDAPPYLRSTPFFGRDRDFKKQTAKVFSTVMSLMLLLLFVDLPEQEEEKKNQRAEKL